MEHLLQETCQCGRVNYPRHGDCAACREYHHTSSRKPLTRCEKPEREVLRNSEKHAKKQNKPEKGFSTPEKRWLSETIKKECF